MSLPSLRLDRGTLVMKEVLPATESLCEADVTFRDEAPDFLKNRVLPVKSSCTILRSRP